MLKVLVPVRENILRAAEQRKATGLGGDISEFLGQFIDLGFDFRLRTLYRQFEAGEISLGYFARELGLSLRELYAVLEERGLPTSSIALPIQAAA